MRSQVTRHTRARPASKTEMKKMAYVPDHGHERAPRNQSVFSIVRNPFDWLISMWFYNWGHAKVRGVWDNLESFLYEFNSYEPSRNQLWNKVSAMDGSGRKRKRTLHFSYRHLQTCQTFDELDTLGEKFSYADFYVRLEMLSEGLDYLNIGPPPHVNKSKHKDYRSYYDTKLIDHITAHRRQELNLLGYDFEGPTDDLSIFKINEPFLWKPALQVPFDG